VVVDSIHAQAHPRAISLRLGVVMDTKRSNLRLLTVVSRFPKQAGEKDTFRALFSLEFCELKKPNIRGFSFLEDIVSRCAKFFAGGLITLSLASAANAQDAHPHVADADREYAAVFSREENPCANESTTFSYEQCMGKELEFTEKHWNAFLAAVRAILSDEDAARVARQASGEVKELDLLNNADRAWREYKKSLCELQFAGFDGGSGASSAATECGYRADRQYVQQVTNAISLKILAK
jgi:uncharacterized protein YecT (DUF1311 family)